MEQIKFKGIVLKSIDYKEKDKLLTIFSLELGKLTAVLKGVRQEKAKLKFAAMPFCFAEFVATNVNGYYTITECYQIESFYDIFSNYKKSVAGFLFLEISCIIMQKTPDESWFLTLLNFLKELEFSKTDEKILEIKFLLTTLKKIGYALSFDYCAECGLKFMGEVHLNLETGELECSTCSNINSVKLTKQQFSVLKIIDLSSLNKLESIKQKEDVLNEIKQVLVKNLNLRLGVILKSVY